MIAVWSYPLFPLVMAIGAWVAFAFHKNRLAAVLIRDDLIRCQLI